MGRFTFGVILGLAIGILDVLLMLPLAFPDKRAALASPPTVAPGQGSGRPVFQDQLSARLAEMTGVSLF